MPVHIFKINTSDFECQQSHQILFLVFYLWNYAFWPISYMSIFFAVLWQLNHVQREEIIRIETEQA